MRSVLGRTISSAFGLLIVLVAWLSTPSHGAAQAEELASHQAVRAACQRARQGRRPELYVIDVQPGWRFGARHVRDDRLPVDASRNFRALDGHVSLLLSGLETPEFEANAEEARALETAREAGAQLRLGFFLGFDDPARQPCVLRSAVGVTNVRADLAFVELRSSGDEAIARADSDRLRAWSDDVEAAAIPGDGPRGVVDIARFTNGDQAPEAWQLALNAEATRARVAVCHAAGVARGVSHEGQVVVRLNVERSGRIRRADVAITSISDSVESECVAHAIGEVGTLPPAPAGWSADVVDVSVPVRLAAD